MSKSGHSIGERCLEAMILNLRYEGCVGIKWQQYTCQVESPERSSRVDRGCEAGGTATEAIYDSGGS